MSYAVQTVRDEIETGIATGIFPPGERLDEMQLAARYGVSRTPIREALMQLSAVGIVEIRPRRGAIVVELGPQRLFEMFQVMAELESMAGALASRHCTELDRHALRESHQRCAAAAQNGDADAYYYENEAFHQAIYAASHNAFLAEQCAMLHRRLRPYRRLQLRVKDRIGASLTEHAEIIDAIFSGNSDATRQRLYAHIVIQGDRFSDLVVSLDEMRSANGARP